MQILIQNENSNKKYKFLYKYEYKFQFKYKYKSTFKGAGAVIPKRLILEHEHKILVTGLILVQLVFASFVFYNNIIVHVPD